MSLNTPVMPGLVRGIHAFVDFGGSGIEDVDVRIKTDHDSLGAIRGQVP